MFSLTMNGIAALTRNIQDICDEIKGDATRKGLHAAAEVIETAYRNNIKYGTQPKTKPRMKDVIAHKLWKYPDGTGMAAIIGTKSGFAPHAHLVEDGTEPRKRTKFGIGGRFKFMMLDAFHNKDAPRANKFLLPRRKGSWDGKLLSPGDPLTRTGAAKAQHPLRRAIESSQDRATEAFIVQFQRIIDKPVVIN